MTPGYSSSASLSSERRTLLDVNLCREREGFVRPKRALAVREEMDAIVAEIERARHGVPLHDR